MSVKIEKKDILVVIAFLCLYIYFIPFIMAIVLKLYALRIYINFKLGV